MNMDLNLRGTAPDGRVLDIYVGSDDANNALKASATLGGKRVALEVSTEDGDPEDFLGESPFSLFLEGTAPEGKLLRVSLWNDGVNGFEWASALLQGEPLANAQSFPLEISQEEDEAED